jgi:pilus assembly protein CpaE
MSDESSEALFFKEKPRDDLDGWLIAVHSLRGGLGCTSIAVNLAIGLQNLWGYPTLLMDNDFVSGQVALMLNASAPRTWADLFAKPDGEFEIDDLASIISFHDSGLHFLAAPANSAEKLNLSHLTLKTALEASLKKYDYLVADLAHDFNDATMEVLKAADRVLLVLSPEIVSVRLAATALRGYRERHFDSNKVQLVLVQNSPQSQLKESEIEKALDHSISHTIPFAPKASNWAISAGVPFLIRDYKIPISSAIEDLAFLSSKPIHQENPPPKPSNTWKRLNNRQESSSDNNQKGKFQLPFLKNFQGISKIAQNFDTGPLGNGPSQNKPD